MAFDPDAYLAARAAPAAPAGGFDPDAYLQAREVNAAPAGAQPIPGVPVARSSMLAPGVGEAALRGGAAGFLSDFSDELAGGIKAFAQGGDIRNLPAQYHQQRDEERARNKAAEEAHPWAYNGARVGGAVASAFVPATSIAKGAGLGAKLANAALMGGAQGYGASEADNLMDQAGDTVAGVATGLTAGALLHGAGKAIAGATGRAENRVIAGITEGATKKQQARILGEAGLNRADVIETVDRVPGLAKAAIQKDSAAAKELVDSRIAEVGNALDKKLYAPVDAASPGMKVSNIMGHLEEIKNRLDGPGKRDLVRAVDAKLNDVLETWGNREYVTAREVRTLATDLGPAAFKSAPGVPPGAAERLGRDVYGKLTGAIEQHVEQVANEKGLNIAVGELRATNKEMSRLLNIQAALSKKATDEAISGARTSFASKVTNAAGVGYSLATANPLPYLATKFGPGLITAADQRLATFMQLARAGGSRAEVLAKAAQLGIPRALAQKAVESMQPQAQ